MGIELIGDIAPPFPSVRLNAIDHIERVAGRRVMVTGAGGSIGSELARQIAECAPAKLTLLDICEFNLYAIDHALKSSGARPRWRACLGDVRDREAMRSIFVREKPEIVFHAAALKHVPLLESSHNIVEAVRTNVVGTKVVCDLCTKFGAEFVMISTDKAVNPSSSMGLTKRVAEILVHDMAQRHQEVRISQVRFGNVVGSSGSVVPLFRQQIAAGGPVTVTHPKMTRYLMSIQQAVRLTLSAAHLTQDGYALYILDMGKPVRILQLAEQMIRAEGFRPYKDIEIQVTGVRPGEKLHEELSYPWEIFVSTPVLGVLRAKPEFEPRSKLPLIEELLVATDARDGRRVKRALLGIVPEFQVCFPHSPAAVWPNGKLERRIAGIKRSTLTHRLRVKHEPQEPLPAAQRDVLKIALDQNPAS